ncbi:hypothetical protein Sme01_67260 [Sphaerisporangium melleum]|uniref:Uncharacterized protein n=1 Tax=Sphaerisporangium melleum TaxID=321316 RepID=A0A917RGM4_9ACTN|nr:hypothetical protein [Sphaerisporangium melleum]GGL06866.1 hypothetical protein GCM10007964_56490 [Sphaerisporangium melleum]GII74250.1 hypothetical protein Sme01_67260 [Sphaerisporangium melleum]
MILKRSVAASALIGLLVGGVAGGAATGWFRNAPEFSVQRVHASHAFDVGNDQVLAGWADNVFVAKVSAKQGQEKMSTTSKMPVTLWSAEIAENYKGDLSGTVTLAQQGGYVQETNSLLLMDDDALLEPGREYLFVSRQSKGRHWIVPHYGDIPLPDPSLRTSVDLRNRWKNAVARQQPDAWKEGLTYTPERG